MDSVHSMYGLAQGAYQSEDTIGNPLLVTHIFNPFPPCFGLLINFVILYFKTRNLMEKGCIVSAARWNLLDVPEWNRITRALPSQDSRWYLLSSWCVPKLKGCTSDYIFGKTSLCRSSAVFLRQDQVQVTRRKILELLLSPCCARSCVVMVSAKFEYFQKQLCCFRQDTALKDWYWGEENNLTWYVFPRGIWFTTRSETGQTGQFLMIVDWLEAESVSHRHYWFLMLRIYRVVKVLKPSSLRKFLVVFILLLLKVFRHVNC